WRTVTVRETSMRRRLIVSIRDFWRLARWLVRRLPPAVRYHFTPSKRNMPSNVFDSEGVALERDAMIRFSRITGESFHPRSLETSGVLLRAHVVDEDLLPLQDHTNGWGGLFKQGLEVIQ